VGAVVTLDLTDDSPMLALPWIITFGPLDDDEEWEPVVCGPYERAHALGLAETVVSDEDLMAVVEPLLPHAAVDDIRSEIAAARLAAESDDDELDEDEEIDELEFDEDVAVSLEDDADSDDEDEADDEDEDEAGDYEEIEPGPPPSPEEVRAGFARIAARLTSPSA
jgi:hypothetical protein